MVPFCQILSNDYFPFKGISIRVGSVPGLGVSTGREISDLNKAMNSQNKNYLTIGFCLGLLGVMYVSALMIYMRSKSKDQSIYKDRTITHRWPLEDSPNITGTESSNISSNGLSPESSPENDSINIDIETDMGSTNNDWRQDVPSNGHQYEVSLK